MDFLEGHLHWEADKGSGGGGDQTPSDEPKPDPKPADQDDSPKPVPYDRFKEVVEANRELTTSVQALQKAEKERQEKQAEEEGKFKDLYETEKDRGDGLEATMLRKDIALEKGLPANLASRLKGETREELEADADALVELLTPGEGKGVPPANKNKSEHEAIDLSDMSPAEVREASKKILGQG